MRFEIFKNADNAFYYELLDNSISILSSPAYVSLDETVEAIKKLIQIAAIESNYQLISDNGDTFIITEGNQELARGGNYSSSDARSSAISSLANSTFQGTDFDVSYKESSKVSKTKIGFEVDLNSYDFSKASTSGKAGFEEILDGKLNYFHFNDAKGKAILFSQSYSSPASRNSAIRSVIQNVAKDERFEIKNEGNSFYFILKAQTGRELARSSQFNSEAAAQAAVDYLKTNANAYSEAYPKPEKKFTREASSVSDNYQLAIHSSSGKAGFEAFQSELNKNHYFHFNNDAGNAILYSQGYQSAVGRDNGIKSIIKNAFIENRYVVVENDGSFYFSLKAGNKQEIARSQSFSSMAELEAAKAYMLINTLNYASNYGLNANEINKTENFSIHIDKPTLMAEQVQNGDSGSPKSNDNHEDDYLVCSEYRERIADSKSEQHSGFIVFTHENGKHYFALLDAAGDLFLRSEGYPSTAARDNGIESVKKNAALPERFKMEENRGFHFISLRAGNHQEIGRSCPYAALADAEARRENHLNPPAPVVAVAAAASLDADDRLEDDYLVCGEYRERIADSKSDKYPGFISFQHANGKYYFAVLDADGDLYLRSEGYPTTAARDNGIESVMRNSEIEERYKIEERRGFNFLTLRAGNHQEIARSCPYQHLADAEGRKGKSFAVAGLAAAGLAIANVEPEAIVPAVEEAVAPAVEAEASATITAESAAFVAAAATIVTAAPVEATPTIEVVEATPVVEVVEDAPVGIATATAAVVASIAASQVELPVVEEIAAPIVEPVAIVAASAVAVAAAIPEKEAYVPQVHKEKEDDYLACAEYKGYPINDKKNNLALFKTKGQYYFVVYNKDGSVRLRSEGFKTSKERDVEVSGLLKNIDNANQYSTIEKAGYSMQVLKDKNGREVGRGCPQKIGGEVAAAPVAAVAAAAAIAGGISLGDVAKVAAPVAVAAAASALGGNTRAAAPMVEEEVAETGGWFGRFWPWLLLGALALAALWYLKGCEKKVEAPTVVTDSTTIAPDTAKVAVAAPVAAVCNCKDNAEPIFNIPVGKTAKKLPRLGTNPEFARYADLHGKTPTEFYAFLKERSEKSAVDKAFLDKISKAMGYANGFADMKETAFSEMVFPIGTIGNLGWGAQHNTAYDELPDNERDRMAFKIAGNGGCSIYFMKTCGNHMFPNSDCK